MNLSALVATIEQPRLKDTKQHQEGKSLVNLGASVPSWQKKTIEPPRLKDSKQHQEGKSLVNLGAFVPSWRKKVHNHQDASTQDYYQK